MATKEMAEFYDSHNEKIVTTIGIMNNLFPDEEEVVKFSALVIVVAILQTWKRRGKHNAFPLILTLVEEILQDPPPQFNNALPGFNYKQILEEAGVGESFRKEREEFLQFMKGAFHEEQSARPPRI